MQDSNGQEIFDLQKRHVVYAHALLPYKYFLSNKKVNILTFTYFFYNFNDHNNTSYLLVL